MSTSKKYATVCLLLIAAVFAVPHQSRSEGILVTGPVVNQLFPDKKVNPLPIVIQVCDQKKILCSPLADFIVGKDSSNGNQIYSRYSKLFPMYYVFKDFSVILVADNYAQMNAIDFIPHREGKYDNTLRIQHKANLAEKKYREAENFEYNGELYAANHAIDQAMSLWPEDKYYFSKINILAKLVKENKSVPQDLLGLGELVMSDKYFNEFSKQKKFKFYIELGNAFAQANDLLKKIGPVATYRDLAVIAYDQAIFINNMDYRGYQAKYEIQRRTNSYLDMIDTIKEFFKNNPKAKSQTNIKTFLMDWCFAIEKLTGFPRKTEEEYINNLAEISTYRSEWGELLRVLHKYRYLYQFGDDMVSERLRQVARRAEKYAGVKS